MDKQAVIEGTRRWIAAMVIGLDLCPFARGVFETERIRYVVSEAVDESQLLADLEAELRTLTTTSQKGIETTLLIHPLTLGNYLDYNDFLDVADRLLSRLRLRGIIQIASFHPDYQFAGTAAEDVENYTNRSLYPMLHLLRESSVAVIANGVIDLAGIPRRNVETLKRLGKDKIAAMRAALESDGENKNEG